MHAHSLSISGSRNWLPHSYSLVNLSNSHIGAQSMQGIDICRAQGYLNPSSVNIWSLLPIKVTSFTFLASRKLWLLITLLCILPALCLFNFPIYYPPVGDYCVNYVPVAISYTPFNNPPILCLLSLRNIELFVLKAPPPLEISLPFNIIPDIFKSAGDSCNPCDTYYIFCLYIQIPASSITCPPPPPPPLV